MLSDHINVVQHDMILWWSSAGIVDSIQDARSAFTIGTSTRNSLVSSFRLKKHETNSWISSKLTEERSGQREVGILRRFCSTISGTPFVFICVRSNEFHFSFLNSLHRFQFLICLRYFRNHLDAISAQYKKNPWCKTPTNHGFSDACYQGTTRATR